MLHYFGADGPPGSRFVWLLSAFIAALAITPDLSGQRPRGPRGKTTALKVGTVHPVSGPAITNGIVLIRGSRIVAVGTAEKIKIPADAEILDYPQAHAYPGLVDALSTAYADQNSLTQADTNASSPMADGLTPYHKASRRLIESGVTTTYVASQSSKMWRGIGIVVHPGSDSFRTMRNAKGAVHMRITASGHPLTRLKTLEGVQKAFDSLEKYEESFEKYAEDKKKYDKEFAEYLDYFREKTAKDKDKPKAKPGDGKGEKKSKTGAKPDGKDAEKKKAEKPEPKKEKEGEKPKPEKKKKGEKPKGKPEAKDSTGKDAKKKPAGKSRSAPKKDDKKAPKRPKAPKEPKKDPGKDALIAVRDGERALHIDVRKPDEIRAALKLARSARIKTVVLEQVTSGAELTDAIARAGAFVVLTDVAAKPGQTLKQDRDGSLAADLHTAGVPVAIGSGSIGRATHLPMLAAQAAGHGLDVDAAVSAITLTPAQILGIAEQVGSLEPRKRADILITTGPLLQSDSRILRVISAGRTAFEAR